MIAGTIISADSNRPFSTKALIFYYYKYVKEYGTYNQFCIPITFNNSLKICFSNKKYPITIQTRPTPIGF